MGQQRDFSVVGSPHGHLFQTSSCGRVSYGCIGSHRDALAAGRLQAEANILTCLLRRFDASNEEVFRRIDPGFPLNDRGDVDW